MRHLLPLSLTGPVVVLLAQITACSSNPADPGTPKIATGTTVEVTTRSVPPSGGTITIDSPGDTLDGMTIEVPDGAYTGARSFRISYAPVVGHELGSDFNPLTPLITISNGGGYSEEPMILDIPVTVPAGHFAMAFLYDAAGNRLEGMPLLESDSNHVKVATASFSHSTVMALGKRTGSANDDPNGSSKIIITSADKRALVGEYDSGFRPGVDDWQYPNFGSWAEPLGHCAGQSLGMMWYYTEKKRTGSPALHGLFDNDAQRRTPTVWQDDVHGYKYSSMVQSDGFGNRLFTLAGVLFQAVAADKSTMFAFRYALKLTGEPQFVGIFPNAPSGHAMVIYRVQGDLLYVADPNYPNDREPFTGAVNPRRIHYDPQIEEFQPYFSGPNASRLGTPFSHIFYMGKSSLVPWNTPSSRWDELENKTIGAGEYPDFNLVALNENVEFVPLVDGFRVPERRLSVAVRGDFASEFSVFNESGKELPFDGSSVELRPGKQLVGIYVKGKQHLVIGGDVMTWVGFRWVPVEVSGDPRSGHDCLSGVKVNNKQPKIDSSEVRVFTVGMQISAYFDDLPNDMFGAITITAPTVNGPGIYKNGSARWDDVGRFSRSFSSHDEGDPNRDFTITVTHLDAQSVEGSFRIKLISSSLPEPYIEGSFSCSR